MNIRSFTLGLLTSCAFGATATAALADPPSRVGRIAYVEGEVSFQPPQEDFWTEAARNFPVAAGEAFWTGDSGRAELEIGATELWLDNQTELDVADLDYGRARFSLAQGSMEIRLRHAPRGGVAIATPAGDIQLNAAGQYRIDVAAPPEDGSYPQVEVTTFDGEAGVPSGDGLVAVDAGEAALIDPGADPYAVDVQDAAIDDWAQDREARERWADWNGESPSMTGYEDLARYGQFVDTEQYGQVWFPSDVPDDWAPYRYGHWASVQPWGWTWIDDQPWGFAPFHYGRWARIDGRWGWVRGQAESEPIYAPALVAFFGGSDFNLGYGEGGALGWTALAPDEAYRPTYQVSNTYLRQVNIANVSQTTINNVTYAPTSVNSFNSYRNASAAVVVGANAFARGMPVQKALLPAPAQALASAPPSIAFRPPAPTPQARAFNTRPESAPGATSAAPPPVNLRAVREGLIAQRPGTLRPPVIAGAQLTPGPKASVAPRAFIAPSQLRNPDAQARTAPPIPHRAPSEPAPGVQAFRPLRPLPGANPPQGDFRAQQQEQMRLQQQQAAQAQAAERARQQQFQQQQEMRLQQQQAAQAQAAERARQQQSQQQQEMRLQQQQAAQAQAAERARQQQDFRAQQQEQMRIQQQQAAQAQAAQRAQQQGQMRVEQQQAAQAAAEARARADAERKRKQQEQQNQGGPPPSR